jgi:adenylylsulfate kinase-like enzyme
LADAVTPGARRSAGRVVWITGLGGSGKTTVATALVRLLRRLGRVAVLLDGDALPASIATDLGYALADRRRAAERYARLAGLLAGQGLTVVVATISMFESVRRANRRRLPRYLEVYLRVPLPRRTSQPQRPRRRREVIAGGPVVGRDLPFEEPTRPDLVFAAPVRHAGPIALRIVRRLVRGR